MLYVRGRPLDYDLWDVPGLGLGRRAARTSCARRTTRAAPPSTTPPAGRCASSDERSPRPLTRRFLAAAEAAGIPRVDDYNGPEQDGASPVPGHPAQRPPLEHQRRLPAPGAQAREPRDRHRRRRRARRALRRARDRRRLPRPAAARARSPRPAREVILAAGAFGSPQLLHALRHRPGRPPARGRRRRRGRLARRSARTSRTTRSTRSCARSPEGSLVDAEHPRYLAEWLLRRSGPLTSTVAEAFAFVRSRPGLPAPDLQFHFAPAYFVDHGVGEFDGHAMTLGPVLIAPRSRGHAAAALGRPGGQAADRHQLAGRARGRRGDGGRRCRLAREIVARRAAARGVRARALPRPACGRRRPRGRPAPPHGAALPPGRHVPDGHRRRVGGRRAAARPRRRGPARGRRVDHAADPRRQHQRADDHGRRARRRPDPREPVPA